MIAATYWTADMVRALPDDGKRYETVYGELLLSPSPGVTYQRVLARLFRALDAYVTREGIGEMLWSPADISWKREERVEEYWVVDVESHAVEVWTPEAMFPRVEERELVWQPAGARESLRIELEKLFAPV